MLPTNLNTKYPRTRESSHLEIRNSQERANKIGWSRGGGGALLGPDNREQQNVR